LSSGSDEISFSWESTARATPIAYIVTFSPFVPRHALARFDASSGVSVELSYERPSVTVIITRGTPLRAPSHMLAIA
tara:strand:- start:300 stop:530 length:231 start_codon:yes stop_codon:yes gene_type:complete